MVKVISLSNEAYGKLKAIKGDRSFSEVVVEITDVRRKKSMMDFFGIWKEDAEYWNNFEKNIEGIRKRAKLRGAKW